MQYEHDQTDQSPKNDQKPNFTLTHHENCANSLRETESQGLSSSSVTWVIYCRPETGNSSTIKGHHVSLW